MTIRKAGHFGFGGQVITPDSSIAKPDSGSRRMHTHSKLFVPRESQSLPASPQAVRPSVGGPPYSGYLFETPASLACIYGLVSATFGCDPNIVTKVATGGSRAVAIVVAFHDATAVDDLQVFSSQFGLPSAKLQVVFASGSQPAVDEGWATEAALDTQMVHAMAPNATIYLVEAASDSAADIYQAVDRANQLVQSAGGGEVSMSFGSDEYGGEAQDDAHFAGSSHVVFFASTGDGPGTEYPSVSPNVVAVGGTSTSRSILGGGALRKETAWSDAGSGLSLYFARPAFQSGIGSAFSGINARAVPDISADANPTTGVWVYCGTGCGTAGWTVVGGTSVASPLVAAMTNAAGSFHTSGKLQLSAMYAKAATSAFFNVTLGTCGPYAGYFTTATGTSNAAKAYDLCTGLGAPRGKGGL